MISFRIDWFELLAVQVILKSLLQQHNSKVSILQYSSFFMVQLSHPYMTTRKTIALSRQNFVGKVMFLLFNMLSKLVIDFLPRNKLFFFFFFKFHGYSHHLQWFWSPRILSLSLFLLFAHLFDIKWWDWMLWSSFFECWVLSQLFTLLFHFHQSIFSSSSFSAIKMVLSAYLSLLVFLQAILILACVTSSLAFLMM